MRKLFYWILGGIFLYALSCLMLVGLCDKYQWSVGEKYIVSSAIQLFAGLATFLAVLFSLFGNVIKKHFDAPHIVFDSACDDKHCVLSKIDDSTATTFPKKILGIYVSAKNVVEREAEAAQLICNKAFASCDGDKFVLLKTFRAASFKWLYSSDDKKFLTTLRHSVEKYAKVIEIIEEEVSSSKDGKPDATDEVSKSRVIHFEICLSINEEKSENIIVGHEYRAVLLSLCLASSATNPRKYYLMIYLKSGNLDTMPTKDRLEIKLLSEKEAQAAVSVNLE